MTSKKQAKAVVVNLNIGDQLTSISCGHIVVELIKFIAYQRLQIPYTYQWLKQVVNKKKFRADEDVKESFQSERHFFVASNALENMDFILKSLLLEINGSVIPEEVCIALGSTPISFKEIYRLILPVVCHKPQCHSTNIASDEKIKRSVFRTMVTSEELNKIFCNTLAPTNMYVLIKKKLYNAQDAILSTDDFEFTTGYRIQKSTRTIVIDFRKECMENISCCSDFEVFGDIEMINHKLSSCSEDNSDEFYEIESSETAKWFQSTYVMKGFKDCVVNGSSITNDWLNL